MLAAYEVNVELAATAVDDDGSVARRSPAERAIEVADRSVREAKQSRGGVLAHELDDASQYPARIAFAIEQGYAMRAQQRTSTSPSG